MKNNKTLGVGISKTDQKSVRGGIAWQDYRDFTCIKNNVQVGYGCTTVSGAGAACCRKANATLVWGPFGCPYEYCSL
jgi:hypothetical protein